MAADDAMISHALKTKLNIAHGAGERPIFLAIVRGCGLPTPTPEYRFAAERHKRQWKFDYAWPEQKIALEVEGGTYVPGGAHSSGAGLMKDMVKYNTAVIDGWLVLQCVPGDRAAGKDNPCGLINLQIIRLLNAAFATRRTRRR